MNLWTEFRLVVRSWRRQPLLGTLVTLSIALGIGMTVLLFGVVHALLLEPFDFPHQERMVRLYASNPTQGYQRAGIALGDAEDLASRLTSLEEVAYVLPRMQALTGGGRPELVDGALVSSRFFALLGFETRAGRLFSSQANHPEAPAVAVLSAGFAQRRYGSADRALGEVLQVDGSPREVIGVLQPGSRFSTRSIDIWTPFVLQGEPLDRRSHYLPTFARLSADASLDTALTELTTVAAQLESEHPETNDGWTATAIDYRETVVGSVRSILWALFAAVMVVLLICCSNVASLLLARATARSSESAVRAAMGASRWRLVRLFLLEGLSLTLLGGLFGVLLAKWGAGLLAHKSGGVLPLATTIDIDLPVLVFAFLVVGLAGLLVGVVPAWRFASQPPAPELRAGLGRTVSGPSSGFRNVLTLVQTGLALVLIVAGGLTIKDLIRLQSSELGFEPEHAAAVQVFLNSERHADSEAQVQFFESWVDRVADRPEVIEAAAGSAVPLHAIGSNSLPYRTAQSTADDDADFASFAAITPGYFDTLQIPILWGRGFTTSDRQDGVPVAIVNSALTKRAWPKGSPIGQKLKMHIRGSEESELEIVGVVGDTLMTGLREPSKPAVYVPFRQFPHQGMLLLFRAQNAQSVMRHAEELVYQLDPQQPVYDAFLIDKMVEDIGQRDRFVVALFTVFGVFGLLLVMVGVYGVVLYSARQREHEIGVRVALGANRVQLYLELMRSSLLPAVFGLGIGLVVAVLASRYLQSLLSEVDALDPAVFIFGISGLAVALLAAGVSAGFRVMARDPARLLHDR